RAGGGDRLDGDDGIEQRAALAALLLWDRDAEQAHLGELLRDVPRVVRGVRPREGAGGEHVACELLDAAAEVALLLRECDGHWFPPRDSPGTPCGLLSVRTGDPASQA